MIPARSPRTPTPTRAPARPGFTMLELSLAALIGGLIVMACFGIFNAMDRADRTLRSRFDQSEQLANLQVIMRRTFVSLVMSSNTEPRPRTGASNQAPTSKDLAASDPASRAAAGSSPASQGSGAQPQVGGAAQSSAVASAAPTDQPLEPPRVVLIEDRRVSETPMTRLPLLDSAEREQSTPTVWKPQRLEVVLRRPPIPVPRPAADGRGISPFPDGNPGRDDSGDVEAGASRLFRGIFELKPVPPGTPGPGGAPVRQITTWALWWRPMPPGKSLDAGLSGRIDEYDLAPPSLVASDLTYLRWQFFDDRLKKAEFATAYFTKLPAYIEMEVQTATGMWASWMFEVDFSMSSEDAGTSDQGSRSSVKGLTSAPKIRNSKPGTSGGSTTPKK